MAFDGFYTGGWWWSGSYSHTKEFNWQNPTTVLAFGALSAISMVGAGSQMVPNNSYVGILEETVIDARGNKPSRLRRPRTQHIQHPASQITTS
jgi:hypothetical protein